MKKKLIIDFETEEDNNKILNSINRWITDNFQDPSKVKVSLEEE